MNLWLHVQQMQFSNDDDIPPLPSPMPPLPSKSRAPPLTTVTLSTPFFFDTERP